LGGSYKDSKDGWMATGSDVLSFGDFHADLVSGELSRRGKKLPLQEKPFCVLAFLLHNSGRVVSREELIQEFWPGPFAADDGLNTAIRKIRQVLRDDPKRPKYVETVGQRGYRFVCAVQAPTPGNNPPGPEWIGLLRFNQISETSPNSFADGLAEEIAACLGRLRPHGLAVTLLRYKDLAAAGAVCRRLGLTWVLTGTVRTCGNRIRLSVMLQRVGKGDIHWAESFERDLDDVFRVQEWLAASVTSGLAETLGIGKPAVQTQSAVRQLYLKARFFWNKRTDASLRTAAETFRKCIKGDPSFAPAYAGLADVAVMQAKHGFVFPSASYAEARQLALNALELDDSLADAYVPLAWSDLVYDRNWDGAEQHFKRATKLNPNYASAHSGYAYLLTAAARFDEAECAFQKALELDPLSLPINTNFGLMLYYQGDYQGAIRQLKETLEFDSNFPLARSSLALVYAVTGQWQPAIMHARAAVEIGAASPLILGGLGYVYASAGRTAEAQDVLRRLESMNVQTWVSPYALALVHLALGSHEAAMDQFEAGERVASQWILFCAVNPKLAPLRPSSRFRALLERLKLKE
jgi:DNA-binding winged helix-turn-helix (wHTH) protein/Flp pilus assembly protein TadD